MQSKAKLFIDAVAPGMFFFTDRMTQGHEVSPEITSVVNQNYKLVDEVQGIRIYLRK